MADPRSSFNQLTEVARLALARGDKDGARASLASAFTMTSLTSGGESAESLYRLGMLYQDAGLDSEAERLFGDAVAVAELSPGENELTLAGALSCLGTRLVARGANDEAEPLLRRALTISEQRLGVDHPDLNGLLNVLSRLYLKRAAFATAGTLLERLLAMKLVKGDEHPEVATVLASLALVRQGLGDHEGAEQLGRRVLQIREKTLAPNHYAIASALEFLADECAARGKVVEAGSLYQRALSIREQTLGVSHASLRVMRERIVDLQLQAADLGGDESFSPTVAAPLTSFAPQWVPPLAPSIAASPKPVSLPPVAAATLPPALSVAAQTVTELAPSLRDMTRAVADASSQGDGRQQALVLPGSAGILALRHELATIDDEMSDSASAAMTRSPIQRAVAAISAMLATRRGQATVGGAVTVLLVVAAVGVQSHGTAEAMTGTSRPQRAADAAVDPASNAVPRGATGDSTSSLVHTAAGAIAFHQAVNPVVPQPSSPRPSDSRTESSSRRNSDDAPSLDISRNVKITAPTIALGRADSIAHASETPSKLVEGSFSRQFWTAGIDKKAVIESSNGPTPAKLIGDMPHPVYPEFLRKNSVEGEVVVRFVIDATGHPDMATFEVVRTPHDAMTAAVRRVVQQMRFEPARTAGPDSPARTELVQISFVFQADPK
jgi:TonB family protein